MTGIIAAGLHLELNEGTLAHVPCKLHSDISYSYRCALTAANTSTLTQTLAHPRFPDPLPSPAAPVCLAQLVCVSVFGGRRRWGLYCF